MKVRPKNKDFLSPENVHF